jgi:hypothetical protein
MRLLRQEIGLEIMAESLLSSGSGDNVSLKYYAYRYYYAPSDTQGLTDEMIATQFTPYKSATIPVTFSSLVSVYIDDISICRGNLAQEVVEFATFATTSSFKTAYASRGNTNVNPTVKITFSNNQITLTARTDGYPVCIRSYACFIIYT